MKILKIFVILSLVSNLIANDVTDSISKLFNKRMNTIIEIVKNKKDDKKVRNLKIVQTITPMFDFELMARLTIGKRYWKKMTKQERKKFTELYVKRMENSYSSKVDSYTNEKIVIKDVIQTKPNRVKLIASIIGNGKDIDIVYKYYKPKRAKKNKDKWLVYDVEILGVSIVKSDKAQFREFLKTKTIQDLMKEMIKVKKQ